MVVTSSLHGVRAHSADAIPVPLSTHLSSRPLASILGWWSVQAGSRAGARVAGGQAGAQVGPAVVGTRGANLQYLGEKTVWAHTEGPRTLGGSDGVHSQAYT